MSLANVCALYVPHERTLRWMRQDCRTKVKTKERTFAAASQIESHQSEPGIREPCFADFTGVCSGVALFAITRRKTRWVSLATAAKECQSQSWSLTATESLKHSLCHSRTVFYHRTTNTQTREQEKSVCTASIDAIIHFSVRNAEARHCEGRVTEKRKTLKRSIEPKEHIAHAPI